MSEASKPHSIREQWLNEVKPLVGRRGDGVGLGVAIIAAEFEEALTGLLEQLDAAQAIVAAARQLPEFFHTPDGRVHSFGPLLDVLDAVSSPASEPKSVTVHWDKFGQMHRSPAFPDSNQESKP